MSTSFYTTLDLFENHLLYLKSVSSSSDPFLHKYDLAMQYITNKRLFDIPKSFDVRIAPKDVQLYSYHSFLQFVDFKMDKLMSELFREEGLRREQVLLAGLQSVMMFVNNSHLLFL